MTERPILFQGAMVRALLDGSKTQTRRVVKPQPHDVVLVASGNHLFDYRDDLGDYSRVVPMEKAVTLCPYGKPGDRLWVKELHRSYADYDRESFARMQERLSVAVEQMPHIVPLQYDADGHRVNWRAPGAKPGKGRPSIHLPRWASRISLEITAVRVERLQSISEADAIAEGIDQSPSLAKPGAFQWCDYHIPHDPCEWFNNPIRSYQSLWESINGPGSWEANPWVWVVEFRRLP